MGASFRAALLVSAATAATACLAPPTEGLASRAEGLDPPCPIDAGSSALSVTVVAPTSGATVSGMVNLKASGTGSIQNIEFFEASGGFLGRATLSGSSGAFAWDTRSHANGKVSIYAKAWNVPPGVTPFVEAASANVGVVVDNGACGSVPAGAIDIRTHGAVASATTDNRAAIQAASDAARVAKKPLYVPAGTFGYKGQVVLDGVSLWGAGGASVLHALDPAQEAFVLRGNGPSVHSVKFTSPATTRLTTPWSAMTWVDHATNFEVACIQVEGASTNGVFVYGGSVGLVHDNSIKNTLADSIHMTDGTNQMQVYKNRIENSGDDGIAVVSYGGVVPGNGPDSAYVRDVKAWGNVILYNKWGRSMSVVGGRRVEYWNNYLQGGTASTACIYLAQEGSYSTWEASDVFAHDNDLVDCGGTVHPASLLVFADQFPNRNIRIDDNHFWKNRGARGSIAVFGTNVDVTQAGNTTDVGAVPPIPAGP